MPFEFAKKSMKDAVAQKMLGTSQRCFTRQELATLGVKDKTKGWRRRLRKQLKDGDLSAGVSKSNKGDMYLEPE